MKQLLIITFLLTAYMVGKGQGDPLPHMSKITFGMGKPIAMKRIHGKFVRDDADIELWSPLGWTNYAPSFSSAKTYNIAWMVDSLCRRLDSLQKRVEELERRHPAFYIPDKIDPGFYIPDSLFRLTIPAGALPDSLLGKPSTGTSHLPTPSIPL